MCDKSHPCSEASFSLWGWPVVTSAALVFLMKNEKNVILRDLEVLNSKFHCNPMISEGIFLCTISQQKGAGLLQQGHTCHYYHCHHILTYITTVIQIQKLWNTKMTTATFQ